MKLCRFVEMGREKPFAGPEFEGELRDRREGRMGGSW